MGARVAIVEQQNCFVGVATISMFNAWHNLFDAEFQQEIIGGLTVQAMERLQRRDAIQIINDSHSFGSVFNSEELKIEPDQMVVQAAFKIYLHTMFVAAHVEEGRLGSIVVESKSGRGAIPAAQFVDTSGDLAARLGQKIYSSSYMQPATACASCKPGITLRYLDGREEYSRPGRKKEHRRWREPTTQNPTFY
jgi:hypothetical protein